MAGSTSETTIRTHENQWGWGLTLDGEEFGRRFDSEEEAVAWIVQAEAAGEVELIRAARVRHERDLAAHRQRIATRSAARTPGCHYCGLPLRGGRCVECC